MLMIHLLLDLPFVNELDTATEMNRQIGVGGVENFCMNYIGGLCDLLKSPSNSFALRPVSSRTDR